MPSSRVPLDLAELRVVARALSPLGIRKVRFTGGEPLLRRDLSGIVRVCRDEIEGAKLALTTNGLRLASRLPALRDAGLQAVTVHVDSLRPDGYAESMGAPALSRAVEAVRAARRVLDEVKVNVVVQRGGNDDELEDFVAFGAREGVEVRFLELMDTGVSADLARTRLVPGGEIVARLRAKPIAGRHPADPARRFRTPDGTEIGVIAPTTEPFCDRCDRLRLSVDGWLRGCLFAPEGVLLRGQRGSELEARIDRAVRDKRSFNPAVVGVPKRRLAVFGMVDRGG